MKEENKKDKEAVEQEKKTKEEGKKVRMVDYLSDEELSPRQKTPESEDAIANRKRSQSAGAGDKWAQMMAKKTEDEFHADRERIRGRRGGGTKFVDEQIRLLLRMIKKHGNASHGLGSCTYGILFKETSDTMPALSATLLQAKKRNIVQFEGDMLMQGTHDHIHVTIITEEVSDTQVYRSSSFNAEDIRDYIKKQESSASPSSCFVCAKTVYPTEKVVANEKVMHKSCFRCTQCSTVLKLASYAFGNAKFYCEPHFQQLFSANGYNF